MKHQVTKFNETKLTVITRSDFKQLGYTLPQSLHSLADFSYEYPEIFIKWKIESNSIISLSCKSEKHLLDIYNKYSKITPTSLFFEPDINEYTSICLYTTPDIRKTLSSLPLSLKNIKTI